jgi:NAD+ synthase
MKKICPKKTATELIRFIKSSFQHFGYKDALIGVSGGVDSATSLILTVQALGKSHVRVVLLPYGRLNAEAVKDAMILIGSLHIPQKNIHCVDIQPMVDAVAAYDKHMGDGRRGNVMARMRMVILFDLSKKLNALVVGTENKTEHLLGYYTRFGDEASDIEPIRHLYKTQVYDLAAYLNVPKIILQKPPTAGLWKGQTDEGEFGFTYKEADEILSLHIDQHKSKQAIIRKGYDCQLVNNIWWWIKKGNLKDRLAIAFSRSV